MDLSPSKIRYLLIIYELSMESPGAIRPIDIANRMKVSRASVAVMLKELAEHGLISRTEESGVRFTVRGHERAMWYYTQYRTLLRFFLQALRQDGVLAREDCMNMVSTLSRESLRYLVHYVKDGRVHYNLS